LGPLATQVDQSRISESQKALNEIKEAVIGYALANKHLPCPDKTGAGGAGTANDGIEDFEVTGLCTVTDGNLPWVTLGTPATDSWGNHYHYNVSVAFSARAPVATFTLSPPPPPPATLRICPTAGCATSAALAEGMAAVILSYGKNGFGAVSSGGTLNPAPTSADELENTNGDFIFVSRTLSPPDAPAGEFDDLLLWISPNVLFNRMVAAGKLP
jgi:type II secretory pathway pseudopilin PulG